MTLIIMSFAIVWSGLCLASALAGAAGRAEMAGKGSWWAGHVAATLVPVAGVIVLQAMPAFWVSIEMPDLAFLAAGEPAGDGGTAGAVASPVWPRISGLLGTGLVVVYGLVTAALLVRHLAGEFRLWRIVQSSLPVFVTDNDIPVHVTAHAITPFADCSLTGKARIVLPARMIEELGEEAMAPVIAHEAAHIARRDPVTGRLLTLAGILFWPSPFMAPLIARWRLAAELQCDAAALTGAAPAMRKRYARTLLAAFRIAAGTSTAKGVAKKVAGRALPCPPAAFSTSQLKDEKMRMIHIMKGGSGERKSSLGPRALVAASVLAVAGIAGTLVTGGAVNAASPDNAQIVEGTITSIYGPRPNPQDTTKSQHHRGVDLKGPLGTPVYAPVDSVVVEAGNNHRGKPAYGNVLVIQSPGNITTVFAHLDSFSVAEGDTVRKGQEIAKMGNSGQSTGPHVHIETYIDGELVDPATVWTGLSR